MIAGEGAQHANWAAEAAVVLWKQAGYDIPAHARQPPREGEQALDLVAAVLIPEAPLDEVLAVVAEQSITILPEARARPVRHLGAIEAGGRLASHPDRPFLRETCKRNLFHRTPAEMPDH